MREESFGGGDPCMRQVTTIYGLALRFAEFLAFRQGCLHGIPAVWLDTERSRLEVFSMLRMAMRLDMHNKNRQTRLIPLPSHQRWRKSTDYSGFSNK
jgi:hypothetical protein